MIVNCLAALALATLVTQAAPSWGETDNAVAPGRVVLEAPTLVCLGVRWYVSGDANGDAAVAVSYRRNREGDWRPAMPLFRVGVGAEGSAEEAEARLRRAPRDRGWPFSLGNLFAGSIFELSPDTEYELKLELSDPDGGGAVQILEARTRPEPVAPPPLRTLHVAPGSGGGAVTAADPFRGLATADAAARPGDLLLVHAGVYEGTFTVTKSGEPGRPIVWRAAGDGEAAIDGLGSERSVAASDLQHVFFEGLSIRNSEFALVAHRSSDIVVRRCHFYDNDKGFVGTNTAKLMRNFYIADNLFEGPSTWPRSKGIESARAIQVSGEGHVVCHNRIRGFGDGIDIMWDTPNRAIDFYGNEISECTDDAIEMDYGMTNVRCFRNRITNCFQGVSAQPAYGGPCYVFRNVMYNLEYTPFKLHNHTAGVLLMHNTAVKSDTPWPLYTSAQVTHAFSRNNLFVGTSGRYGMEFSPPMVDCDLDRDGFAGGPFENFARWNGQVYESFEGFRRGSGIERHSVLLGSSAFASGLEAPADHRDRFPLTVNDLRLAAGSEAVDAGVVLPNVNDGYEGPAPDLGAYELGEALPHYGPRGRATQGGTVLP
jgi:hypothetical protein